MDGARAMTSSILHSIEETAARMGIVKKRLAPDYRRVGWLIKCSKCPAEYVASWHQNMAPDGMRRFLLHRGWDVGHGMRPLCPVCKLGDKAPKAKPEHQTFKPWVPPRTAIFDGLLLAASEKVRKQQVNNALDTLLECEMEIRSIREEEAELKEKRRELTAEEEAARKLAAMQERARAAGKRRLERIEERRRAEAASAAALRLAKLKERCGTEAPAVEVETTVQPTEEEVMNAPRLAPAPKISHAVFQCLDGVFDPEKRLYRSGYTDARVAKECGTSEEVVSYLRTETFGQLAEDPRYSAVRDDLELLRMESAEVFAKLQKQLAEISSRVEQLARK